MSSLAGKKILVTGGSGFIGSSIVRKLLDNNSQVSVVDNFSKTNNLKDIVNDNLTIIQANCASIDDLQKIPYEFDFLFHFAANAEVNLSSTNTKSLFDNNILATQNILEWFKNSKCKTIIFPSTSTIYGDASIMPTPETYSPCNPISFYGASKLACEAMISSYCQSYNKQGIIFRLANIIGSHSDHGIIPDMIKKLSHSKDTLEILGDGTQMKSYLHRHYLVIQ